MPLFVDDVEIEEVYVDGEEITEIYVDGELVWEAGGGWPSIGWSGNSIAFNDGFGRTSHGFEVSGFSFRGYYLWDIAPPAIVGAWKLVNSDATMTPPGISCGSGGMGFEVSGIQIRAYELIAAPPDTGPWVNMLIGGGLSGNTTGLSGFATYGLQTSGRQMRGFLQISGSGTPGPWVTID